VYSSSVDPYFNLALEEYLMFTKKKNEIILYLWQNKNTIVLGHNQNPWKECNLHLARQNHVKIARRSSGGGAVFHDLGNLNFTFLMDNAIYHEKKQLEVILAAVNSFHLHAYFSGRNDLLIDGKKFSGNAYFYGDEVSYHHGTLLVNADLQNLTSYLSPSKQKIASNGIDSVKSRVQNLSDSNKEITIASLKNALISSVTETYGPIHSITTFHSDSLQDSFFSKLLKKYASWEFRFGESPSFDLSLEDKFSWGEIQLHFSFQDAKITKLTIYTDALHSYFVEQLQAALLHVNFNYPDMERAITSIPWKKSEIIIKDDLLSLIQLGGSNG
jgi:lipoate-protein ligase A